ncbi:hypothetical protein CR203_06745 [Salipaludibacillus neizhouensis]|uniref:Uncharacterized protein n=1 Tax=Salipaludibacillus neizhouensis TaxID=885475 RepID=A0A3A9K7H6_9BACI|nr:hypothetical protein [Salipaludibacillus neizhouensis]RKL68179.1 hypothetical protein CR203_06745 [Salipaludibacillus neizhouensis]
MRKIHFIQIFSGIMILLLIGCAGEEGENLEVLVFSESLFDEVAQSEIDDLVGDLWNSKSEMKPVESQFFLPLHERLLIEIASHNGDILLVNDEVLDMTVDSEGLYAFDDYFPEDLLQVPDVVLDSLPEDDQSNVYAYPLHHSDVFSELLNDEKLYAIVPIYVDDPDSSFALLEGFIEKEKR